MDIISYALSKKGMQQSVSDYLDEHLTNPTNPPLDTSLTIANAAADSKATGDKFSELKEDLDKYEPLISTNLFDYDSRTDNVQLSSDLNQPTAFNGRSVSAPILINNTKSSYTTFTFNKKIEIIAYYNEQGVRLGQYDYNSWTSVDGGYTREITTNKNPVYICIQWVSNPSSQIGTYIDASDLMLTYDSGHTSSGVKPFLPYDLNAPAYLGNRIGLYSEIPKYRQLDSCFFIGENSGKRNNEVDLGDGDNGRWNTGIGVSALENNTDGDHCTAIGYRALYNNTIGDGNTGLGEDSLHNNTTGGGNSAVGAHSLQNNVTGNSNTAVGESALIDNTTGYYNTALGDFAGAHGVNVTADDRLTLIGNKAGKNTNSIITNSTAIGSGAKVTKSNQVVLGNGSVEELVFGNKKITFNLDGTVTWESI